LRLAPGCSMKPLVGLLYNPAVPAVIDYAPELVEYIEVIPDRLWYDLGVDETDGRRFRNVRGAVEELKRCSRGRVVAGHGIGLSLPSAIPLDLEQVEHVACLASELGFQWYSEHLSMFLVARGSVPNSQAGLGLPVPYDAETLDILRPKLRTLRESVGCDLLMENGAFFTHIPNMPMSEPEFLNRLHGDLNCGTLLDLHNLYVGWRNGGPEPSAYCEQLNPDAVKEIHLAGGDVLAGFYTDSHSDITPRDVWSYAYSIAPKLRNLRAITFEFHESYFAKIKLEGIVAELERLHELSEAAPKSANEETCSPISNRR
jgi:uncharacterized protein